MGLALQLPRSLIPSPCESAARAITANLEHAISDGMLTSIAEFGSRVAGLRKGTGGLDQEEGSVIWIRPRSFDLLSLAIYWAR